MDDMVQVSDELRSVHDILREKHPQAHPAAPEALLEEEAGSINPVIFDSITAALVRQTALHARKRICCSNRQATSGDRRTGSTE